MTVWKRYLRLAALLLVLCPSVASAGEMASPMAFADGAAVLDFDGTWSPLDAAPLTCIYTEDAAAICPWEWTLFLAAFASYVATTAEVFAACAPNPVSSVTCPVAIALKAAANISLVGAEMALIECIENGGSGGRDDGPPIKQT